MGNRITGKRKEEEEKTKRSGFDVEEYMASRNGGTARKTETAKKHFDVVDYMENRRSASTLGADLEELGRRTNVRFASWQSREEMNAGRSEITSMMDRIERVKQYASGGTVQADADWLKSLDSVAENYRSLLSSYDEQSKIYAKYTNAEEYQRAAEEAAAAARKIENYKNADLGKIEKNLAAYDAKIASSRTQLEQGISGYRTSGDLSGTQDVNFLREQIGLLENARNNLNAEYNAAKKVQDAEKLASARGNADFEEAAQRGSQIANPDAREGWNMNVSNPVEFVRDNYDDIYKYQVVQTGTIQPGVVVKGLGEFGTNEWVERIHAMTDDEAAIYNYYLGKGERKNAISYLKSKEEELSQRVATGWFEKSLEGNTALEMVFAAAANVRQSGIEKLFSGGKAVNPSILEYETSIVREDLADNGPKILGSSVGQIAYDTISTTANQLPSILTSYLVGTVNPAAGAAVGSALLGADAAGEARNEMLRLGYDRERADAYALLVGASETGLQYLLGGITSLGRGGEGAFDPAVQAAVGKIDEALGRAAAKPAVAAALKTARTGIKTLGNAASEGVEEYLQDILEPVFRNVIFSEKNEIDLLSADALYSGLLGALSAGILEGPSNIAEDVRTEVWGRRISRDKTSVDRLVSLGQTFSADSAAGQIASEVTEDTDAFVIGKLFAEVGASLSEQNRTDIENALIEKGVAGRDARIASRWMADLMDGAAMTETQRRALEMNEPLAEVMREVVINPNSTAYQRLTNYESVRQLARQRAASEQTSRKAEEPESEPAEEAAAQTETEEAGGGMEALAREVFETNREEGPKTPIPFERTGTYAEEDVTLPEATRENAPEQTGAEEKNAPRDVLTAREEAPANDGQVNAEQETARNTEESTKKAAPAAAEEVKTEAPANERQVKEEEPEQKTDVRADLARELKKVKDDIPDAVVQALASEAETSGVSAEEFVRGVADGYRYGYSGVSRAALADTVFFSRLPGRTQDDAYGLGAAAARAEAQEAGKKNRALANGKTGRRKGTVRGEGVSIAELSKTFNDPQRRAYKIISSIAEATGIDVVLYASDADSEGNRTAANGRYSRNEPGTLYVDINAGVLRQSDASDLGKYVMLRTFSHEFVHFLENWSPEEYNTFRSVVFDTLTERGENANDLIESRMAEDEKLSYDAASREVVAEAMTDVLPDSEFVSRIAESQPTVFEKLRARLKEFIEEIRTYFRSIGANPAREAAALKEERDGEVRYVEKIVRMFDELAETAVGTYQLTVAEDVRAVTEEQGTDAAEKNAKAPAETPETQTANILLDKVCRIKGFDLGVVRTPAGIFAGSGAALVCVDEEALNEALKTRKFKELSGRAAEAFYRAAVQAKNRIEGPMYRYLAGNNQKKTAVFRNKVFNDGGFAFDEKILRIYDGYELFYPDGKNPIPVVAKTKDGKIVGMFYPMKLAEYDHVNFEKLEPLKLKSFPAPGTEKTENIQPEVKGNENERKPDGGTVRNPDNDGTRTARLLENRKTADVPGTGEEREAARNPAAEGTGSERSGERADAERNGRSGREGSRSLGNLRDAGGVTPAAAPENVQTAEQTETQTETQTEKQTGPQTATEETEATGEAEAQTEQDFKAENDAETSGEKEAKAEELHEAVKQQEAEQSRAEPKGSNFVIGESLDLPSGEKSRFRANIDAIRLVKQLESEGRYATAEEQAVLSRYVGWGGLSNAFGESRWNRETRKSEMTAKSGWENEYAEFRKLVEDGIITEDEYKAAAGSTTNAHYTSVEVIRAMYDSLAALGFDGGRMLEPASGVGNFVGAMPAQMTAKVKSWTMVELDSITGLIAKYLYPNADVRIQGFESANIPNNYMDAAIGNVPFGNYGVVDRTYPKRVTKSIHNYFFAKSLDKVRPGGIVMFITSSFTMNEKDTALRQYLADRADLLGAVRLPDSAFKGNAGTEVVTDILVLKKRAPGTEYAGEAFLKAPETKVREDSWRAPNINEYFNAHPEMVLGTPAIERGMYGAETLTYKAREDAGTLGDQIRKALGTITAKMDYPAQPTAEQSNFEAARKEGKPKKNGFRLTNGGKVLQDVDGEIVEITDKALEKKIAGLVGIRDAYRALVNALQQGQAEKIVQKYRAELNAAYDSFSGKYGPINKPANKSAIAADPDCFSVYSLENYDPKTKTATKADIFTKDTVSANRTVTHTDTIGEGVIVSVNTTGRVDAPLIARLTGKSLEETTRELIDGKLAFKNARGVLEAPDVYLSGNVRAKLREAEALAHFDADYKNNVEELKKVIPEDVPYSEIFVTPGAPWIPETVYADFIAKMLGGSNSPNKYGGPDVTVTRSPITGDWAIELNNARLKNRVENRQEWGTNRRTFLDLIGAIMSGTSLTVKDTIEGPDGKKTSVLNKVETAAAMEKAERINAEFTRWLWEDETRRSDLASLYNDTYNAFVTPKYSGEHLTVNGLNAAFTLREHQANAVQRIISSGGNTLLAHKVGAGKTLEMAAAAMKMRELGIVKKPMFIVPKALVAQWGTEFKSYFPAAKLLVSDEKSFTKENRKVFSNKIANGDYDAVILSYEQFEKVPMSAEYQNTFYQDQIDEIIAAINEEKAESGKDSMTIKQMETRRKQLEKKIEELTTKAKDTENVDFEGLGVDALFVDEAHNFKNLQYVTRMNNVAGLGNTEGSQRAFDLYTKIRYLQGLNGGRGIVFATATPVMNSMAEMYIMQKYLQSDLLNSLGLKTFDAWAKQFGEVVTNYEIKPSGQGYRQKQSFSNFRNLSELQMLFRSFADVLTEVPGLKIPRMRDGKVKVIESPMGEYQQNFMKLLEMRAENVKSADPREDNMLKITSDGRKIAYTQRMIDPSLPYEPEGKIHKAVENIYSEYKASDKIKGTQIVFLDMATPTGRSKTEKTENVSAEAEPDETSARLYDDMKLFLTKKGIPAEEIAFIHDADTDAKKQALFDDVNEGKVRVLIGSTGKMGVGMNAQKRVVAIHHLDAPWRPGDVEQRDGRAFRQKNMNEEVAKYVYVTTGSFDARLWDILDRKQHFINQIMSGENVGRTAEDTGDVTLSAAEVKALASGNTLVLEEVKVGAEVKKLENLQKAHQSEVTKARTKAMEDEQAIYLTGRYLENAKKDLSARTDEYQDGKFRMKIGDAVFTDKKQAGAALFAAILQNAKVGEYTKVGEFAGFELRAIKKDFEYAGQVLGKQGYGFNVYADSTTRMVTNLCALVGGLENRIDGWTEQMAELKRDLDFQKARADEPFDRLSELNEKRARYQEIIAELSAPDGQIGGEETQEQARQAVLTDRDLLESAADLIDEDKLTEGERFALETLKKKLSEQRDLEEQRTELGRTYREQQFGKSVDRAAAAETLERMKILDEKIARKTAEVLHVKDAKVLRAVLTKARRVLEARAREQSDERLARYRARTQETAEVQKYKKQIRRDVDEMTKWALNPGSKDLLKHVPETIRGSVIPFLASIDFNSQKNTAADKSFLAQLEKLKAGLRENAEAEGLYSGYNDLPVGFMEELQSFIDTARSFAENNTAAYVISEMNTEELKNLSQIVTTLKKFVQNMNSFLGNAAFEHVWEAGDASISKLRSRGDAKNVGGLSDFLFWQNIRPAFAFERFGEGGLAIYDELRDAQKKLAQNSKATIEFAEKTYSADEVRAWEKETKTFRLGKDDVVIPVSFMMGLYELAKQPDSLRHIKGEGIRVATYLDGKKKISDNGHVITGSDLRMILAELTPRQKEVADALQNFMATTGSEWGNFVSVKRFGVEQFTNPRYYPINSDGRHLDNNLEERPGNASLYALLNMSFTKTRNENADNRIVLYSIFDVFANHMASMAQYNAFAIPILDALKWFNYKDIQMDDLTQKPFSNGSVREELARVFGVPEESRPGKGRSGYAEDFITGIIRAYNGTETQAISTDSLGLRMLRRHNMAQIGYNLRVVMQQPMAVTRAGLLVDYRSILRGMTLRPEQIRRNTQEMLEHSGIAAWKKLGFYDINISRGMNDLIKHNTTAIDTINEVGMRGAAWADDVTWAAMWSACKEEIRSKNEIAENSEEFFDAVTKLFEDVIYKTQVVDSVLTKSEFMRSKGYFARAISSFMSEPVTSASMALDAYFKYQSDLQDGRSPQEAWQRNRENIGRTTAVYAVSAILLAAVQSVADAWRDDDDDENALEKYWSAFAGNVVDELMPFNKLPIFSDFYDIAKQMISIFGVDTYGNPPQTILAQWYDALIKGTEILYKKISGSNTGYTWYAGIRKMLQAASGITGLPFAPITREIVDVWNNTVGKLAPSLRIDTYKDK